MRKKSDDYINSYAEWDRARAEREEYMKAHPNPESLFEIHYELTKAGWEGERIDKIFAHSDTAARERVEADWWKLGIGVKILSSKRISIGEFDRG